jgi:hypothetical protein
MPPTGSFSTINRDPQNVPLPLGGMAPVRVQRPRRRRAIREWAVGFVLAVGLGCAATGIALLLLPRSDSVELRADRVQVGTMVLTRVGAAGATSPALYVGEASYVLLERGGGSATAAAAWMSAGAISSGVCNLKPEGAGLMEACSFMMGSNRLTSVDILNPARGSYWQRTYADGVRVSIDVSPDGAAIPVPFPVGR